MPLRIPGQPGLFDHLALEEGGAALVRLFRGAGRAREGVIFFEKNRKTGENRPFFIT